MTTYTATFNVQTEDVEAAYAHLFGVIDAHCIVRSSDWNPTGTEGLYVFTFTYSAAFDVEAVAIIDDANKAHGRPFDAVRIHRQQGPRLVAVTA